jgi:ABC-type antimicrobial peptide transport system permease subunit
MRPGVAAGAAKANLQAIARRADKLFSADPHATGNTLDVLGVERPAQIVDYRSTGFTPVILAGGLALGAIVALGLTLGSSVRRRKRDLALLKSFGFTRRQLMSAIGWQARVDAVVGVVVGVPLGVVLGRELWTLFARSIDAVPDATVPGLVVALVAVGTLVFVNLVAVLPGLSAARTSTALVLRAE